jgi:hypothetical protein
VKDVHERQVEGAPMILEAPMILDQVTCKTFDGAEPADPADETVINRQPYDAHKVIRGGTENPASLGLDADVAKK